MKRMRNRTSSIGRRQFSVENAYTVIQRMPTSSAPSTVSNNASSAAVWPSVRFRPRRFAHRPLPSITIATCAGMRRGSRPAGKSSGTAASYLSSAAHERPPTLDAARALDRGDQPGSGTRSRTYTTSTHRGRAGAWSTPTCTSRCRPTSPTPHASRPPRSTTSRGVVACGGDGLVCAARRARRRARRRPRDRARGLGQRLRPPPRDPARRPGRRRRAPALGARRARRPLPGRDRRRHAARGRRPSPTPGFDAEANRWANTVDWAGGTPLYVLATLRTLASYRPRRVRVTVDDDVLETDAWLVAVGNTRSYAGGMMITPDAALDDGALDVCVVGRVSRADFLRTFPKVFDGTHTRHPLVTMRRGTQRHDRDARGARRRPSCGRAASGSARSPRDSRPCPARSVWSAT